MLNETNKWYGGRKDQYFTVCKAGSHNTNFGTLKNKINKIKLIYLPLLRVFQNLIKILNTNLNVDKVIHICLDHELFLKLVIFFVHRISRETREKYLNQQIIFMY